jgi:hypothetical protein
MKKTFFSSLVSLLLAVQVFGSFGYYSPISINSAQVPSTQTDFPVLVSVTDARFKTVGNGGHVQNTSGFDIRPYSDSGLTTAITGYELERYNASTGEVVMWVKVASLSSSTTPIYLAYGDSGISTDGSSTTTWSNHFLNVYHFKDGTSLNVNDSTSSAINGSNHSTTATTGQVDGGVGLVSASSQYISTTSGAVGTALTYSIWLKGTTFPNDYNGTISRGAGGTDSSAIFVKSSGKLYCVIGCVSGTPNFDGTGSHTLSTGTWYYLTLTYSSAAGMIAYVNAASDQTVAAAGNVTTTQIDTDFGRQRATATRYFNGVFDEIRNADVARSADWITTEYNNQSAPGTFATLGTEVSTGPIISPNRVTNFFFSD